jgi:hypothetical protein
LYRLTRERLYVDSPLLRVEVVQLEGTVAAKVLRDVDELVAAIVAAGREGAGRKAG